MESELNSRSKLKVPLIILTSTLSLHAPILNENKELCDDHDDKLRL